MSKKENKDLVFAQSPIATIMSNIEGFTKREVQRAIHARKLQSMLGGPGKADYEGMLRAKMIDDCPITVDIKNAHSIFGPDMVGLRGRTTRKRPEHVEIKLVDIPKNIISQHKYCLLVADIMFINRTPFLLTRTRGIQLITIEYLPRRTTKIIGEKLLRVLHFYRRAGIIIQSALMDKEFDAVRAECPNLPINTCAANEHMPKIERTMRAVKNRARGVYNTLPFKEGIPKLMLIELLHFTVLWLNAFPIRSGISSTYSPRELVVRHKLNAKTHCKTPFGAYCETHDEPTPSNSMTPQTHEAICLGPTGNAQGSYKFYCLNTQKKLTRCHWTEMPMPQNIIRKIHRHAKLDKMDKNITFQNRNNIPFDFNNDEYDDNDVHCEPDFAPYPDIHQQAEIAARNSAIIPREETDADLDPQASLPTPAGDDADDDVENNNGDETVGDDEIDVVNGPERPEPNLIDMEDLDGDIDDNARPVDPVGDPNDMRHNDVAPEPLGRGHRQRRRNQFLTYPGEDVFAMYRADTAEEMVDEYMNTTLSIKERNEIDSYLPAMFEFIVTQFGTKAALHKIKHGTDDEMRELLVQHCMSHYSLKSGLRKFGKRGEIAITNELGQFHDLSVFVPVDATKLSQEERQEALASLIFLKEKRDGTIKARACADGRKQRETTAIEEAASPTMSVESVFMTCAIEAKEHRDVAVLDLPGAFLHANCDEHVIMKFQGRLAELMSMVAPQIYPKYITTDSRGS